MKYYLLVLIAFNLVSVKAQDIVSLDNVSCVGNFLTFDLTITNGGIPVNINNSSDFFLLDEMSNTVFNAPFDPTTCCSGSAVPIENIPINGTLNTGTCADIIGTNVTFDGGGRTSPASTSFPNFGAASVATANPIPTLGEWALILLFLTIVLIGLVNLKQREEIITSK